SVEHDRIVSVSPSGDWGARLLFELGYYRSGFLRRLFQCRSVRRRNRFDQIGIGHAGRPVVIVVDHHLGELIVIEAEDDLAKWIILWRCRSACGVWRPPLQLLYHGRTQMDGLGGSRGNTGDSRH